MEDPLPQYLAKSFVFQPKITIIKGVPPHNFDVQALWCIGFDRGTLTPMLFKASSKTESNPPMFGIGVVISDGLAFVSSVGVAVGTVGTLYLAFFTKC